MTSTKVSDCLWHACPTHMLTAVCFTCKLLGCLKTHLSDRRLVHFIATFAAGTCDKSENPHVLAKSFVPLIFVRIIK